MTTGIKCPIDGFECMNKCVRQHENQGSTFCTRWVEFQREEGRAKLEDSSKKTTGKSK